ncbi:hypothetical protein SKAU_G00049540 [Synaphobranchus kaupii]|uniref:Uncharacterized protein n=1 Tax=Synaphobranchus kaupii TaxID=118154 RepID=A0A9Q1G2S0_SYNKA|nr:hypothetical protein SKAU_G00049540 [Synaphobranchus kaupii]
MKWGKALNVMVTVTGAEGERDYCWPAEPKAETARRALLFKGQMRSVATRRGVVRAPHLWPGSAWHRRSTARLNGLRSCDNGSRVEAAAIRRSRKKNSINLV